MKSVCIIGAGASGLTAIKCCKDEGLAPVCFERTEELGGLWNYHEQQREDGQASVYKSTVINTSKEMMSYSDYPIPSEYPIYMHNKHVAQYFNLYADEFGLRKYIQFQTSVNIMQMINMGCWNGLNYWNGPPETAYYLKSDLCYTLEWENFLAQKKTPTYLPYTGLWPFDRRNNLP